MSPGRLRLLRARLGDVEGLELPDVVHSRLRAVGDDRASRPESRGRRDPVRWRQVPAEHPLYAHAAVLRHGHVRRHRAHRQGRGRPGQGRTPRRSATIRSPTATYDANKPSSQLWIHVTAWHSILRCYEMFGPGRLSEAEEQQFWAECARAAELQTIDPGNGSSFARRSASVLRRLASPPRVVRGCPGHGAFHPRARAWPCRRTPAALSPAPGARARRAPAGRHLHLPAVHA